MNKYLSHIVTSYSRSKCSISIREKRIIGIKERRKKGKGCIKKQDPRRLHVETSRIHLLEHIVPLTKSINESVVALIWRERDRSHTTRCTGVHLLIGFISSHVRVALAKWCSLLFFFFTKRNLFHSPPKPRRSVNDPRNKIRILLNIVLVRSSIRVRLIECISNAFGVFVFKLPFRFFVYIHIQGMERRSRLSKKRNRSKVKASVCACVCVIYFLIGKDVMDLAHLLSARRSMSRFTLDLTNTIVNHNIYPISATFYFLFPWTFLHHSHGNPVVTILRVGTISNTWIKGHHPFERTNRRYRYFHPMEWKNFA